MGKYKDERELLAIGGGIRQNNPWLVEQGGFTRQSWGSSSSKRLFSNYANLIDRLVFYYGFEDESTLVQPVWGEDYLNGNQTPGYPRENLVDVPPSSFLPATGKDRLAWNFNHNNKQWLEFPNFSTALHELDYNKPFSLSFWLYWTFPAWDQVIFNTNKSSMSINSIYSYITLGNRLHIGISSTAGNRISRSVNFALFANTWVLVTLTYRGNRSSNGFSIYVNGVKPASTTNTAGVVASIGDQSIELAGWIAVQNYCLGGKLDQFLIWNKELTATDVTDLYQSGQGLTFDYVPALIRKRSSFFADFYGYSNFIGPESRPTNNEIYVDRFSAPGDRRTCRGYLDAESQSLSAYNALPYRNLEGRRWLQETEPSVFASVPETDSGYSWIANLDR
jgi:hypothetical protein